MTNLLQRRTLLVIFLGVQQGSSLILGGAAIILTMLHVFDRTQQVVVAGERLRSLFVAVLGLVYGFLELTNLLLEEPLFLQIGLLLFHCSFGLVFECKFSCRQPLTDIFDGLLVDFFTIFPPLPLALELLEADLHAFIS